MADFKKKELERYRKMLLERREDIVAKSKQTVTGGALSGGTLGDEADQASHATEAALAWRLLDKDRKLRKEIDHARKKFETGEYGYCEGTGKPINKKRLLIRPWTRYSIEHKMEIEKEKKQRRIGEGTKINQLF